MTITIELPKEIEARLKREAEKRRRSIEEVAVDVLGETLPKDLPSLGEIIAVIQAAPPDSDNVREARGSLAEAPDFDLENWKREWAAVEAEMEAITRADDIAERHL
ncbi:MAG: hypothetical protein ACLFV5_07260 [Anaerolineales bacterium]